MTVLEIALRLELKEKVTGHHAPKLLDSALGFQKRAERVSYTELTLISLPLSFADETWDEITPAHPREDVLLTLIAWVQLDTIIVLPWHSDIGAIVV